MTMRRQYDMVIQYALIRKSAKAYEANAEWWGLMGD